MASVVKPDLRRGFRNGQGHESMRRPCPSGGTLADLRPGVEGVGLPGGHGEVLPGCCRPLISPGGVDMDGFSVQNGHRPDVGVVGQGVAVNALQLQQEVVGAGVAVADGFSVPEQAVGQVADGGIVRSVVIGAVGGNPLVIGKGNLPLGGAGGRRWRRSAPSGGIPLSFHRQWSRISAGCTRRQCRSR